MTKAKTTANGFPNMLGEAFAMSNVGSRAQAFWKAQEAAADHMRTFFEGWCERRREAAASAADCCAHLMSNGDLPAASRAWTEWMSGEAERLREDAQAQAELTTQIASDMAGGLATNGVARDRRKPAPAAESQESARSRSPSADPR